MPEFRIDQEIPAQGNNILVLYIIRGFARHQLIVEEDAIITIGRLIGVFAHIVDIGGVNI